MEHKNLTIFIVIAAVILAAVYFMAFQEQPLAPEEQASPISSDTSLSVIENDLNSTEVDSLDQEFVDIDAELEAAISEAQ